MRFGGGHEIHLEAVGKDRRRAARVDIHDRLRRRDVAGAHTVEHRDSVTFAFEFLPQPFLGLEDSGPQR